MLDGLKSPSPKAAAKILTVLGADARTVTRGLKLAEQVQELKREQRARRSAKAFLEPAVAAIIDASPGLERRDQPGSPVHQALEIALGRAIARYATLDGRLEVARPLLSTPMLLCDPAVAAQFALVLSIDRQPDPEFIARRWQAALNDPLHVRDFAAESLALLEFFRSEAESAELEPWLQRARPAPDGGGADAPLGAGAATTALLAHSLTESRQQLAEIRKLLDTGVTPDLPPGLRVHLYDQTELIAEHTRGFVGRVSVMAEIKNVIDTRDRAYCHVLAHPGVGKTALLAALIKEENYVHHFNMRTLGIVSPQTFLGNVCVRLIGKYGLRHAALPPRAFQDGGYLTELLTEITGRGQRKVVIVVDALDESDTSALLPGTNPLYLPRDIPSGVIFVISSRPAGDPRGKWQVPRISADCEQVTIAIDHTSAANMADIRQYLRPWPGRDGIAGYMKRHGYDAARFVDDLAQRSEGNFMYLRHVLPAIERGELTDRDLTELPQGLEQYYSDHLERMRDRDQDAWFDYKLPVISVFRTLRGRGPVTVEAIALLSGITNLARVRDTLRQWRAFIVPAPVLDGGVPREAYRIYHASFEDYLCAQAS